VSYYSKIVSKCHVVAGGKKQKKLKVKNNKDVQNNIKIVLNAFVY